jgi:competence protein ComEC
MPAIVPLASGHVAGVAAGLLLAWSLWILTPAAAAVALCCWRRATRVALACLGLAAGTVWGGAARLERPDCAARLPARCVLPADTTGPRRALQRAATERLERLFGERAAIAAALTIDPEARIGRAERETFRSSGLTHLLSISGFHVGILAAALMLVLRAGRVPEAPARVAGTLAVGAYIWLLGAPAPAVRSAALLTLWAWSRIRQRPALPLAGIAVTAAVVATVDPFAVFAPGPWLSFAGAWGCVAAAAWWKEAARGSAALLRNPLWRVGVQPIAVSIGATLATAPITILAFGTSTPAAIVANIAAVPLAAAIVPALALALILAAPGGGTSLAVAGIPAAAADLGLAVLARVAALSGRVPLGTVTFEHRLGAAATAALVAWLVLRRRSSVLPRPAGALLLSRTLPAALLVAAVLAWAPVVSLPVTAEPAAGGELTLYFLPVGQGDGAVIRTPRGRWIVIDAGPREGAWDAGARVVVPFLKRQGAGRIAVLVMSHAHADHVGGMPAVLRALPVDLALETGQPDGQALYREYLAAVARRAGRWHAARAGERYAIDGVTLRVWHPDSAWLAYSDDLNENSLVLTVEYGGFRAAFPGDAGLPMEGLLGPAIGDVTLLKVGHHGSRTATGDVWLRALRPEHCVIAVGRNEYGHPDEGTVAAMERDHCAIWRTDRDGLVTVRTDGRAVIVAGGRSRPRAGNAGSSGSGRPGRGNSSRSRG